MPKLKKKVVANNTEVKAEKLDVRFPFFYIKYVGETYSIMHRLSHTFIESVDTEEALVDSMKFWLSMDEREFWEWMMDKRFVKVPSKQEMLHGKTDSERENWYYNAWSVYTELFYTRHPELLVVAEDYPRELISAIRKERYANEVAENKMREQERLVNEKKWKETERSAKVEDKQKAKQELVEGKIGSAPSLDRLRRKKKKGNKVLKIKVGSRQIKVIDSDDPFA